LAGFKSIKEVVDAELEGRVRTYMFRKQFSQLNQPRCWLDLSMSAGTPPPKYWFDADPLTAKAIYQSQDGGIYHGANVSPMTKYLRVITIQANNSISAVYACPMNFILLDYLLYYPTVDDGTTDEQLMDNTVTLPRYTDGKGVQIMSVIVGARTGGQTFRVKYTNSDGVTGRLSQICIQNTDSFANVVGAIANSAGTTAGAASWMVPLADGDTGVRAIESVQMISGTDIGLSSFILVKPLAQICSTESMVSAAGAISTQNEKDFLIPTGSLPIIEDDAFLGFVCLPFTGISSVSFTGSLKVIWN